MIFLRKPIITEKSMKLAASGIYTFEVDKNATKDLVAKAVADRFKVLVVNVKIINTKGETKWQKRVRRSYQTGGIKKALVQLKKGQKIALFETAPKDETVVGSPEGESVTLKEKKDLLGRTKVKVEKSAVGAAPTTQRKVITGK